MPIRSAIVLLFALAPSAAADEPAIVDAIPDKTAAPRLSLDLSLRYTSDYFFRGIVQRSDAANLQPSAEVGVTVLDGEYCSLSILGGTWSNFSDDLASGHDGSFAEHWYEYDAYAGLSLTVSRLAIDAVYTWYFSPASDFAEVQDITLTIAYDDSGLWDEGGRFTLSPTLAIAFETRHAVSGPDSGVWLGLGLEPAVTLGDSVLGPTTLSFPMAMGLSLDDYYQSADGSSDTFGFAEVGAKLSFDMADRLGRAAPTLDIGVSALILGGVLDDLNAGDPDEVIFTLGLAWSF